MKYEENKSLAHLFHLIIDKNQLRKGYAKKLIHHAEKILKTDDIKKIRLNVVKKNQIAKELFYSMGFRERNSKSPSSVKMEKDLF